MLLDHLALGYAIALVNIYNTMLMLYGMAYQLAMFYVVMLMRVQRSLRVTVSVCAG